MKEMIISYFIAYLLLFSAEDVLIQSLFYKHDFKKMRNILEWRPSNFFYFMSKFIAQLEIKMVSKYILSDLYRYCGNTTWKSFIKNYFFNRGFNFSVWLRLASSKGLLAKIAYPIFYYKKKKYGIDIHCTTKIGYGLYIGHGGPLVVNPTTVIGHNVNLSQFTTIGANGGTQAAEIGDNVYIGPNVCIVNHVVIGHNATIGAGSVVTKNIPANATAVGNYAKVIHFNHAGQSVNRRWTHFD
jgi:serine O-acetyltransferase